MPWLAMIAGIAYSTWLLGFWLNPDLDTVDGYVSELSASDQPYHLLFGGGDFVTGTLTAIVAVVMFRRSRVTEPVGWNRPGWNRLGWNRLGWAALLGFGCFAIGDAVFPLECAPSLSTTCALRERAGEVSFAHQFHAVTSTSAITAAILSMLALTLAARRYGRWPVIARYGWPLMVIETVTALATLLLMVEGEWLGLVQRVQVTALSLWLLLIAWELRDA